ncbi:MAG: 3-deoxy-D-manno-octulosonic acid transferase [Acidobacteriota bacterium]|nr:3-deoxy-D-manno-octulosonic acid transferase [Acidobacteriota bacterium]
MSPLFLLRREKYASGFWQRLGFLPEFEADGKTVVWIHCVSVGETNAARPLVEKLKQEFPEHKIVISTTTKTGQKLAREIFAEIADLVFYFPYDWKFSVRRALNKIKPNNVLIMETEIWFRFLRESYKNGTQNILVNGRLSEKSAKNYSLIRSFMKRALHYFDLTLMQSQNDARHLINLGIRSRKVKITGNIKFDQDFKQNESDLTENLRRRFNISNDSPLIIAASTHSPEEKLIFEAFTKVWKNSPDKLPRLLIAPRHPERFADVEKQIRETGFDWVKRSKKASARDKSAEIILLDSIGELRQVLPLAEIVFVGGSLIPHGGQNIIEPAISKKAIITGHYTRNFEAIVKEFLENEALIQLPKLNENEVSEYLSNVIEELLENSEKREKLAQNALAVMKKNRGATEKTFQYLKPFLEGKVERRGY